jgi:hypothetical protein
VIKALAAVLFVGVLAVNAQQLPIPLSNLNAGPHAPLYTTYAAPLARSEYFVDEGYHLDYDIADEGVSYTTDSSGNLAVGWRLGKITALSAKDFFQQPVVHRSYTDIAEVEYWPFTTIQVRETFDVYSSRLALLELAVSNHGDKPQDLVAYVYYWNTEPVADARIEQNQWITFRHHIDPQTWSETPHSQFDPDFHDVLMLGVPADAWGGYGSIADMQKEMSAHDSLNGVVQGQVHGVVLAKQLTLAPGETKTLRVIRGVQPAKENADDLIASAKKLLSQPLAALIAESEAQYAHIPGNVHFPKDEWEMAYWSAFSLIRQQFLPAEGEARHNYYVFSREPTWSWGHDGQVFHESIAMQAYEFMDAQSAQESQRVFMDRQAADGYIGYRIGPYVTRTFPLNGEPTSSAPFFSWTNWEIYRVSHDRKFLQDAYASGERFAEWILKHRDMDNDGFLEWGGNAMLENVRDALDVIWNLYGGQDASPSRVKAMDLMCMMVMEMRSLAQMARELGNAADAANWNARADRMADLVRTRMWDSHDGFFYHLDRETKTFTTRDGKSLKRKEIIGFLPMWAGIATKEQAARLAQHVSDVASFNRRFGAPTLAADDAFFDPYITRCCQWNGAVWLLWDYIVERGLLQYGYRREAVQIVQHAMDGVLFQLRNNHRFWESFSPDYTQLNSPKNYLWDAIIARMMIDLYGAPPK